MTDKQTNSRIILTNLYILSLNQLCLLSVFGFQSFNQFDINLPRRSFNQFNISLHCWVHQCRVRLNVVLEIHACRNRGPGFVSKTTIFCHAYTTYTIILSLKLKNKQEIALLIAKLSISQIYMLGIYARYGGPLGTCIFRRKLCLFHRIELCFPYKCNHFPYKCNIFLWK